MDLTYHEARAILVADDAFELSFDARQSCGKILGIEEGDAWRRLVESAVARVTAYEGRSPDRGVSPASHAGDNDPEQQRKL